MNENKKEQVNHPSHYNQGIEVIDFIESWNMDFATGNIIKYVSRHPFKEEPLKDLKKAKWYLDRIIEKYERKENDRKIKDAILNGYYMKCEENEK